MWSAMAMQDIKMRYRGSLLGPYTIKHYQASIRCMLTNKAPVGAYRGAGGPEAVYALERTMDTAARTLGIDPAEIRRRNFIQPDQFPYANPGGTTYDSGNYPGLLDHTLEVAEYDALLQERRLR